MEPGRSMAALVPAIFTRPQPRRKLVIRCPQSCPDGNQLSRADVNDTFEILVVAKGHSDVPVNRQHRRLRNEKAPTQAANRDGRGQSADSARNPVAKRLDALGHALQRHGRGRICPRRPCLRETRLSAGATGGCRLTRISHQPQEPEARDRGRDNDVPSLALRAYVAILLERAIP